MARNRMQTALVIVTTLYMLALTAPALASWSGIDLPEARSMRSSRPSSSRMAGMN